MAVSESFRSTRLPYVDKTVLRLGVAGNYGLEGKDFQLANDLGVTYWLWGASFKKMTQPLREILGKDRERHTVAVLSPALWPGQVRKWVDKALQRLDCDYIDVFKLGWLGRTARYAPSIIDVLHKLRDEGKVRTLGTSIHDRIRAGALVRDSAIDVFMLRYNAKHPGAEQDIFPHLPQRQPAVVTYTTTSWRQLLRPLRGVTMPPWPGEPKLPVPPLTPSLCYRFALSNDNVHVVLTAPKSGDQLRENLAVLDEGPLPPEEMEWVRQYGRILKQRRRLPFV